jgi:hypothetical protein
MMSHKPIATQGYINDEHPVISPELVATKGHISQAV